MKLLAPDRYGDPKAARRLVRETRSASALNHPNIVTVHSIEESDGRDFIVMEYVEGEDLRCRLKRGPRSPCSTTERYRVSTAGPAQPPR